MTYRAKRAVINKGKVFTRHKDGTHPSCRETNKGSKRSQIELRKETSSEC